MQTLSRNFASNLSSSLLKQTAVGGPEFSSKSTRPHSRLNQHHPTSQARNRISPRMPPAILEEMRIGTMIMPTDEPGEWAKIFRIISATSFTVSLPSRPNFVRSAHVMQASGRMELNHWHRRVQERLRSVERGKFQPYTLKSSASAFFTFSAVFSSENSPTSWWHCTCIQSTTAFDPRRLSVRR